MNSHPAYEATKKYLMETHDLPAEERWAGDSNSLMAEAVRQSSRPSAVNEEELHFMCDRNETDPITGASIQSLVFLDDPHCIRVVRWRLPHPNATNPERSYRTAPVELNPSELDYFSQLEKALWRSVPSVEWEIV